MIYENLLAYKLNVTEKRIRLATEKKIEIIKTLSPKDKETILDRKDCRILKIEETEKEIKLTVGYF